MKCIAQTFSIQCKFLNLLQPSDLSYFVFPVVSISFNLSEILALEFFKIHFCIIHLLLSLLIMCEA